MLHYARLDTHYLLEIFDKLRKDLYQQAMSLKMSPETVIASVYASSHQVSRIEAELFDYRKKQLYVTQKESMSAEEFAVIDRVFELIDAFAKKEDVAFDDLANNRTMTEIIARIKDMQRETNATNLRIKIERLLGILKQYHKHSPLLLPLLKEKL